MKKFTYRVLIIEDSLEWYDDMLYFLDQLAKKFDFLLKIELAKDCYSARQLMGKKFFHYVAIDLRLPEKVGGPLTSNPMGIELAIEQTKIMPLVFGHIFTGYAKEYALECYREMSDKNSSIIPPIWEKASSDNEGEDAYTQKQWAGRVIAGLLPRSIALTTPIVAERTKLKKHLNSCSPLGESMDFAIETGQKKLPPCLAHSCAVIHRFLKQGDPAYELPAFQEVLFLAESIQYWLWTQAAAKLLAIERSDQIRWPLISTGGEPSRAAMESSLKAMCNILVKLSSSLANDVWLDHLHLMMGDDEMNIIDALRAIRFIRNKHYHENTGEVLPWDSLATPLRIILDSCSFLASYPILSQPKPAPDGRWRFALLQGETKPMPESEWTLTTGIFGEKQRFSPEREDEFIYQLWSHSNTGLGLLKLWPFVEQRITPNHGRNIWLLVGPDTNTRDSSRFWEFNIMTGRTQSNVISPERLAFLEKLNIT